MVLADLWGQSQKAYSRYFNEEVDLTSPDVELGSHVPTEYIPWWTSADVATLSTAFILAFSSELTPRLDINHNIRSRQLPSQDIAWLRTLPQSIVGELGTSITLYQDI